MDATQERLSPKPMMHIIIAYSPYFHKIYKFSPNFRKIYKFPLFSFSLSFFSSPNFDHDAFMHHALHILDASGATWEFDWLIN